MLAAAKQGKLPDDLRSQIEPLGKPDKSPDVQAAAEGWRQFNEGKFRSAERSFRRALAKDPENVAALNGLGFCLLDTGKAASAKQYFEKCLKLEPDAAGPMNGLARCLKAEGKVDEAIALWERMHKKYPGPNAAAVGLAMTYAERKEFDKALPLFEELVKSQPENEEFRKGLEAAKAGATAKEATQRNDQRLAATRAAGALKRAAGDTTWQGTKPLARLGLAAGRHRPPHSKSGFPA